MNFYSFSQADFYAFDSKGAIEKIENLKKNLPALQGSKRIDCLNDLSESYLTIDKDTSRLYAAQALIEADKISYIPGQAKAYRNLGRIEINLITDLPAAEKYFNKSLALYISTHNEREIAWAWGALGVSQWVLSKFPEAMEAFKKAAQLFEKIRDTTDLIATYQFMGSTTFEWGHYAKSLEYVLKNKDLTGSEDNDALSRLYAALGDDKTSEEYIRKIRIDTTNDAGKYLFLALGGLFSHKKQYDSAFYYYNLFSNYAKKGGAGPLSKLYACLGQVHLELKNYDTALVYLNEALNMSRKGNDRNQVMRVLLILSKAYGEKGDYKNSRENAEDLLQMADKTGARQFARDAHFVLYKAFNHLQKRDSAYVHLEKYTFLKDSVDMDLSYQKLAFNKTKSEREQTESRINVLNEEKKLQLQLLQQTTHEKNFLITGIIAVVLIAVALFRNILLKRKNERHLREIAENELQIQKLESEKTKAELQQKATELEMQALRAQMNPHFIFNCLNAINGYILNNEPEMAADYLTKFSRLIRMVLNNSQKQFISLEEELETLGLYLHMESLRFKDNFNYEIKCDDTIDAFSLFIPPMLLQPFVENAIWHGLMNKKRDRKLIIGLHFENDVLHCTIADNGVGRKKAALLKSKSAEKNKSMGMDITRNRMALLNHDLDGKSFFEINDLEDEYGKSAGTSVSLKIRPRDTAIENISEVKHRKIIN
ncbi:MAG: histidine kinase [Bacteroidota bacterium]|nr:histidine kinase [Bacteroidota bacterium]